MPTTTNRSQIRNLHPKKHRMKKTFLDGNKTNFYRIKNCVSGCFRPAYLVNILAKCGEIPIVWGSKYKVQTRYFTSHSLDHYPWVCLLCVYVYVVSVS